MYSFSELSDRPDSPFCYLLGVLKRWPPKKWVSADFFTGQFEWLLNVEDQSDTAWQTRRRHKLTKWFVLPTAPLTITPAWSPFPLAFDVLPNVMQHGCSEEDNSSAFAIFTPDVRTAEVLTYSVGTSAFTMERSVKDRDVALENIHAQHFMWLLDMTVARAAKLKKPIILAGTVGFGYEDQLETEISGDSKLRLIEAGYLYPSRVPQGARFSFLSDPIAREKRAQKLERMRKTTEGMFRPLPGA